MKLAKEEYGLISGKEILLYLPLFASLSVRRMTTKGKVCFGKAGPMNWNGYVPGKRV